jgi:hypothetical protein
LCAGSRPGAGSGLTLPNLDGSCDPAPRAAGFGCVRGFAAPMAAGWRPGITHRLHPRQATLGGATKAHQSCATFRTRHAGVEGPCSGRHRIGKGAFEKPILALPASASGWCPLRLTLKLPAASTRFWPGP